MVISADGYVLTVAHVGERAGRQVVVVFPDGRRARAVTLGNDHGADAGMAKITDPGPWPHAEMASSGDLKPGQWCLTLGYPITFEHGRPPVVRVGRVLHNERPAIITDCTIMGGDSGAPLFNLEGKVVAIGTKCNNAIVFNLHVPMDRFAEVWDRLAKGEDFDSLAPPSRRAMREKAMSVGRPAELILLACWMLLAGPQVLGGQEPAAGGRPRDEGRWRRSITNGKNEPAVKSAFQEALAGASSATVRIRADGAEVALGAVVDPSGYIVTKASVLGGKITCRFKDGQEREARIVGQDAGHDLALLQVDAVNLPAVTWREGDPPPPGSFVASSGPADQPLALGVVSTGLRRIPGPRGRRRPQGWLGIGLREGESGVGVESVERHSPAEKAGIHVDDEIRKIDGDEMKSADQIVATVGSRAPQQTIRLLIHRKDQDIEISATLAKPKPPHAPEDEWGGGPFSERRSGFPAVLPHDTPLRPKDCGGPLVDTDGRVAGINIARALRVTTYALPARDVRQVISELRRKSQSTAKN